MEKKKTATDEALVKRAQSGDKAAMEELLVRYGDTVRRRARGFFLAGGETEDLIQEGMIGLYNAIGDYSPEENGAQFKSFAFLCITRRMIDAVKSSARLKNVPLNNYVSIFDSDWDLFDDSPEEKMIMLEDRREFIQKMNRALSDFEFRIIVMYMEGMSCAEICAVTGRTEKSVDNAIQRSKKKLQNLVKK
ncbi:MAG: sigma-70 family RNA polymerase sigma factor [Clostridia bacterium]|nr:sigma-70 family RNA polymerase sigma factor [Clostridia bacterium]